MNESFFSFKDARASSRLVLWGLLAIHFFLAGCASTSQGPSPADTNRDGILSEAEFNAEMARIQAETKAAEDELKQLEKPSA